MLHFRIYLLTSSLLFSYFVQPIFSQTVMECMTAKLITADDTLTIGELRLQCSEPVAGATEKDRPDLVGERLRQEDRNVLQPFTLMAHKPNYILLGTYNNEGYNSDLYSQELGRDDLSFDKSEMQFQISIKFPLMVNLFEDSMDIYAAYTTRSFWQIFNSSSPFRETNHEPEIWFQFHPDWEFFSFKNTWNSFGFNHQSNGKGGELSRSWNRIFGWITFERESLAISIRPWYRINEDELEDDNPDITDYLGHFELSGAYKWHEQVFSIMSRNNLESGFKRGAIELGWSFPLAGYPYLKGYVQYFYGYGESLIDYDQRVNRIGVGLSLVDWL